MLAAFAAAQRGLLNPKSVVYLVLNLVGSATLAVEAVLVAQWGFLLEGGVFTPDLIETWIDYKRANEIDPIRLRPHPHEFELYYDI